MEGLQGEREHEGSGRAVHDPKRERSLHGNKQVVRHGCNFY